MHDPAKRSRNINGTFACDPLTDRFWSKVASGVDADCWQWLSSKTRYGTFQLAGKKAQAHRVAFELSKGKIPEGMHVLHKCDNPACCNPSHLFLGTHKDNMADMTSKGRRNPSDRRGAKNTQARLSVSDVEKIRADKRLHRIIAAEFSISRPHVSGIRSGKFWK